MRQWIKDFIRKEATALGKAHAIKDVGRIEIILRKTAIGNNWARLDTDKGVCEADEYGLCFSPSLEELLTHLSPGDAMQLLEDNEPDDLWYVIDFLIDRCEAEPFLYTYQEMTYLLEEFTKYLQENKALLLQTGYPSRVFKENHWLFDRLSTMYPVKIPYSITGTNKDSKETILHYTWCKERAEKRSGSSSTDCSYIEAPFIEDFSNREIFEVEEKRKKVFQLKIEIFKILQESLVAERADGLWDRCLESLSGTLSQEDFHSLIGIEEKFSSLSRTDMAHKLSFVLVEGRPLNLTASLLNCGGVKNILGIIEFTERELKMGRMHQMKTKLLAVNGNKEIPSYYHLFLSGTIPQLIDTAEQFKAYNEEEEEHFRKIFDGRLERDISRHFKVSLLIKPEYYDTARAFAEYVHDKNIHANLVDHLKKMENFKERVTTIKLPPGTKWEDITIKFVDGYVVIITAPGFRIKTDYKEMEFVNKKTLSPNVQWRFLRGLADDRGELSRNTALQYRAVKKTKSDLSKALRSCFELNEDPFLPYKQVKAYKTRFNLIPESDEGIGEFTEDYLGYPYQ